MDEITKAQRAVDRAKENLTSTVRDARSNGRTWAEIGEALGMSRQAAFKRFGEVTNPATGQKIKGVRMSIDTIRQTTEQVFDLIATGDYGSLDKLIHPDVREELPDSLIAETWAMVLKEIGAKESFEDTHVEMPAGERITEDADILGTVVGVTTVSFEAGEMMGRVALDDQMRVVGLLIVSTDASDVPF